MDGITRKMGCLQTKTKVEPLPETIIPLPTPQAPSETDPRLPLNARQVFRLKKNWKGIKRKLEVTGVEMFTRFVSWYLYLQYTLPCSPAALLSHNSSLFHSGWV